MRKITLALAITLLVLIISGCSNTTNNPETDFNEQIFSQLETDLSKNEIDLSLVLSGGPGKDGIPAISNPKFNNIANTQLDDEIFGILVDVAGDTRFYPYTILVWHEIVNDTVGGKDISVTFCPLCGSAIVFDRNVGEQLLDFGVSGLLYQSNLLMYDRQTESLWSQALGKAVVGQFTGTNLELIPMQRLTYGEVKQNYPEAMIMNNNTGYSRNYGIYPYGDYETNDNLIFPVEIQDTRFEAKKIMLVVSLGDKSVAFPWTDLPSTANLDVDGDKIIVNKNKNQADVTVNGEIVPTYFEMWFSWATHHQENGIVWTP